MNAMLRILTLVAGLAVTTSHAQSPSRLDLQLSQGIGAAGAPAAATGAVQASPAAASHRIDRGDSVTVTVYQEPDLGISNQKVRSDGTLSLPLLGDLHVAGLTSKELQRLIAERLADGYLKQPNITVNVEQYRLYFIKGEVESPGGYSFVDGLTIEKAIAVAGGYTERASKRNITVVRESDPERPVKNVAASARVQPGDVITVEESFF